MDKRNQRPVRPVRPGQGEAKGPGRNGMRGLGNTAKSGDPRKVDPRAQMDPKKRAYEAAVAKKKAQRKKMLTGILIGEIALLLILCAFVFCFFLIKASIDNSNQQQAEETFAESDVYINEDAKKGTGYTQIMLYGVDSRDNTSLLSGTNADTEIVLVINNETSEITMCSIMRDTCLGTTNNKYRKITDSYCAYGVQSSMEMMNYNLDLSVTKYVAVNWRAVIQAIDILGGVDIEILPAEISQINYFGEEANRYAGFGNYQPLTQSGKVHLNGAQACGFARVRNVNRNGSTDDWARTDRQRELVQAALVSAKNVGLGSLNDLILKVMPGISTNITFDEAMDYAKAISDFKITNSGRFPFDYKSGGSYGYLFPNTLSSNVTKLHEVLFGEVGYQPSSTVQTASSNLDYYRQTH